MKMKYEIMNNMKQLKRNTKEEYKNKVCLQEGEKDIDILLLKD